MMEASGRSPAGSSAPRRALWATLLALLLTLAAWPAQAQGLDKARAAFQQGRYQEAAAALSPRAQRDNLEGLLLLARVKMATGQRVQASQHLKHVIASGQGELLAHALTLSGQIEVDAGRYEVALKLWAKAQEVQPGYTPAHLQAGLLLQELGRKKEGDAALEALISRYTQDTGEGSLEQLSQLQQRWSALSPEQKRDLAQEWTWLGIALWKMEYYNDANEVLGDATQPDSPLLEAWQLGGDLFLEKYNTKDARFFYESALKRNPHFVPALVGMARVELEESYNLKGAQRWLEQALEVNPSRTDAIVLRAQLQIDDGDYEGAQATLGEVLKLNPRHLDALTLLAACAYLSDDQKAYKAHQRAVFKISPKRARFYADIARLVARVHRYPEAISLNEEALKLDPGYWPAFVELGISYTRVGNDKKGIEYLAKAFEQDPYNVRAYHMAEFYDGSGAQSLRHYSFVDEGPLRFRFHRAEKEVLTQVLVPLASEAFASMGQRYHFKPPHKINVEVFRDQASFSVRSVGLPSISPHGICFGRVVTSRSPSEGNFNWAEVIWHELAHVYHLHLSHSRVPRWFTEGLAEFEAGVARSEWRREQDLEIVAALREGRLLGIAQLNHGFTHARNLGEVINAYFQSTLVIEFIESRWGFDALTQMLKLYGKGLSTAEVFKKTTRLDLPAFDLAFLEYLKGRYSTVLASFEPGTATFFDLERHQQAAQRAPKDASAAGRYASALFLARRLDEAEAEAQRALGLDPEEPHARFLMSFLALRAGDLPGARRHLESMVAHGHDGYSVRLRLGQLSARQERREEALQHYNQALIFFPRGVEAYRELAQLHTNSPQADPEQLAESLRQITELDQSDFDSALRLLKLERAQSDLPLARRAAQRALHIRPFSREAQVLAAELALEDGDGPGAAASYRVALLLSARESPERRAELHLGLARALARSGDKRQARQSLERAAELAPQHPELEQVRALLR